MLILVAAIILFSTYCAYEMGKIRGERIGWDLCDKNWEVAFEDFSKRYNIETQITRGKKTDE